MDSRPSLFRETPPYRPGLRDLVRLMVPIVGAVAFLALVVGIIAWVNSLPSTAWE